MGFPSSPINGQQVVVNNITYVYNNTKTAWSRLSTPGVPLSANSLVLTSPNVSISTTSGALIVTGGAGIGGNLHADRYYTHNGLYWANNNESILGGLTYSNVEVAAYLNSQKITSANIGGSQIFANANAATQATSINTINANIGTYQTYANANAAAQQIQIDNIVSSANTNTAAYLQSYTGNIQGGNVFVVTSLRWSGNGAVIETGGGGGGSGAFTANTVPPTTGNVAGDQWYNTSTDILYEYIDDGTSEYWVDVASGAITSNGTVAVATVLNDLTVTGNILPSANITYDLGSSNYRWRDLFLSGSTIDLGGATIKTDAGSGAIALIPQPTVANPNPTGIVVSPAGTVSTVSTTGGELTANAIGNSSNSAVASATTTFGNIVASGNITTANLIANSNVVANKITTTTGFFWSNGTAFASSTYGNTEVAAYLVANPQGSTYSNANVAGYLTSNVSGIASTTGALNIPIGTTEERPASAQLGSLRYNTTLGVAEVYTLSGWTTITGAVPTITNVTPSSYGGEVGAVFTIFGTGFQPDALVRFVTANASEYISNTVSYGNTTTLQATTPRAFSVAEGPLDVRVIQANGSASVTRFDAIQTGTSPTWTTASGTLATIYDNATGTHATIAATDSESSITYSVVSGSLPPGTTLNASTGAISGDPTDVESQTTSTFTAAATDAGGNQVTRSFSIVVRPYLDGSTSAKAAGSPAQLATVTGTTPTNGVYWYKNSGYNSGTAFQAYTDWSINSNTGYMILTQSQISGAAITNFTDVGTASTSASGTRGHNNTFREPTATILSGWSGDTSNRCLVGQYRTSTGTTLATGTNLQWIQIAVTPATFKLMFDDVPGAGEFTGTISARSAGGTGSFYWSKNNSEYPNHNQMGNALTDNGWNGNNYIEIRQAGGDTNHGFFVAGDGSGSYYAASLALNGGSGERVGFFGFAPNNTI